MLDNFRVLEIMVHEGCCKNKQITWNKDNDANSITVTTCHKKIEESENCSADNVIKLDKERKKT